MLSPPRDKVSSPPHDVLNPAELQRRCVQFEHRVRVLEKRLAQKDAERLELFQEAKLLHDEKQQQTAVLARSTEEKEVLRAKVAEVGKVCQKLLSERGEWRSKEQQLRKEAQEWNNIVAELRTENQQLRQRIEREQETVRQQDRDIQQHLEAREDAVRREKEAEARQKAAQAAKKSGETQTDLGIDEQQRKLVEADAVAVVGLTEARSSAVEVQQLRRKVMRLQASNATTNQACNTYWKAIQEQEQELGMLSREVEQLRREKEQERAQLLAQLREAESRERENHVAIENIRARDLNVEDTRRELERLEGRELEALRSKLGSTRAEIADLHARLSQASEEKEASRRKSAELMTFLQQERLRADEQRNADHEEIQLLNVENKEVMEEYMEVKTQRDDLRGRQRGLEDQLAQLKETRAVEAEAHGRCVLQFQAEMRGHQQQIAALEEVVERSRQLPTNSPTRKTASPAARAPTDEPPPAESRGVSSPPADPPAPEESEQTEALRQEVAQLRSQLADAQAPPPTATPPPPRREETEPSASPPTRLQDLLQRMSQASGEGHAASPGAGRVDETSEKELGVWAGLLRKLCGRLTEALEGLHRMAAYLADKRGVNTAASAALIAGGVEIHPTNRHADPWWNKAFELCSGLRSCTRHAQQSVVYIVAEWEVLRRMQNQSGAAPGTQAPPSWRGGEGPGAPAASTDHEPVYDPAAVAYLPPLPRPAQGGMTAPPRSVTGSGATSEVGMGIQQEHRQIAMGGGFPPVDLESTNTDPSQNADDYVQCVRLIGDSDTLLRAAQGEQPFWGDSRIVSLQQEMAHLQHVPALAGAPPSQAASQASAPIVTPAQPSPPAGDDGKGEVSPSRRTMRWNTGISTPVPDDGPPEAEPFHAEAP
eukprot:Hpha_TRINITY_DN13137_c0_g1::TRINITY_DN13137_c0_g1_i1::g.113338::m.113338